MIDSIRKTCTAGTVTEFTLSASAVACRVKNFSDGAVLVCTGNEWDENHNIRINSNMYEDIRANSEPGGGPRHAFCKMLIQAETTGIVEVIRHG